MNNIPRLVLVEWQDSHADGAWRQIGDGIEDRALLCRSVGWLVLDGENAKVVAPHINESEEGVPLQVCGAMTIPARAVLRITNLTQHDPNGDLTAATYHPSVASCPVPA